MGQLPRPRGQVRVHRCAQPGPQTSSLSPATPSGEMMVQTARWTPGLWGLAPGQRPIDLWAPGQEPVGKDINPHPVYQARALSAAPICCLALSPRAAQVPSSGLPPLTSCQRPGVTGICAELRSLVRVSPRPEPAPGGVPARLGGGPCEAAPGVMGCSPTSLTRERQGDVSERPGRGHGGDPRPPPWKAEAGPASVPHQLLAARSGTRPPTSSLPPAAASMLPGSLSPHLASPRWHHPVLWAGHTTLPRPRASGAARTPRAVSG